MSKAIILFALLLASTLALSSSIKMTTWNVEHLMSESRFIEWKSFCEPNNWKDPKDHSRPEFLNYCNALSGKWRNQVEGAPVRTLEKLKEKQKALRKRAAVLDSDIYFFQEVSDKNAIEAILHSPKKYRVASSNEYLPTGKKISQNVGIAYKPGVFESEPSINLYKPLMIQHSDGHFVRPALEISGKINNIDISFLVVHLKAGCRNQEIDRPSRKKACITFAKQVYELEKWIEGKAESGQDFIVVGDFNRDFSKDQKHKARSNGNNAIQPPSKSSMTRSLLKEIRDGDPKGSYVYYPKQRIKSVDEGHYCVGKIDHFLMGENLANRVTNSKPFSLKSTGTQYLDKGEEYVKPSDHCPISISLDI